MSEAESSEGYRKVLITGQEAHSFYRPVDTTILYGNETSAVRPVVELVDY